MNREYPEWGNNDAYKKTMSKLDVTPKERYREIASTAAQILCSTQLNFQTFDIKKLEDAFFDILWNGYLIPSTPMMFNFGNNNGLPISCFGSKVADDMYEIGRKNLEIMMLSKVGGGTSIDVSSLRPIGSDIKGGKLGKSDGIIPFIKILDSTIQASKQGNTRRGALAVYLDIEHPEAKEFIKIRDKGTDPNRVCDNIHNGCLHSNEFMNKVLEGDKEARELFSSEIITRYETGEPYMIFTDNVKDAIPMWWRNTTYKGIPLVDLVAASNLCTEIFLPQHDDLTFICALSSLNLTKFDRWMGIRYDIGINRNVDVVELSLLLIDAGVSEFITKGKEYKGFEDAIKFAKLTRALGLGALGWHSYLQEKGLPFNSVSSTLLNKKIFSYIHSKTEAANKFYGEFLGSPALCKDGKRRWLTTTAIAPNRNSARMAGNKSQGCMPIYSNYYTDGTSSGSITYKNLELEKLLISLGKNTQDVWDSILENSGSIQHLDFISDEDKEVFLTAHEINQLGVVEQFAQRQKYICQGQSLNLHFPANADSAWITKVHIEAWKLGIKSLYYLKAKTDLQADSKTFDECVACEG